jgi:hypothetical protein
MAALTYTGPQELVFPHLRALDGAEGTLVLRPGESYDFGGGQAGYDAPPGPSWWWKAADPPPVPVKAPAAVPAGDEKAGA